MESERDVLKAMQEYDTEYPLNDYKNWLYNENYSVALDHGGKLYPPKKIWSMVIGIETPGFNTEEATTNLEDRGFRIVTKPGATRR